MQKTGLFKNKCSINSIQSILFYIVEEFITFTMIRESRKSWFRSQVIFIYIYIYQSVKGGSSPCLVAGGKCRNGKWLCFTLYFFLVYLYSAYPATVFTTIDPLQLCTILKTNFYTRVKLNLILFFFSLSAILLLVALHLKLWNNVRRIFSLPQTLVEAKPFFLSSIGEKDSNMREKEIWYFFFLLSVRKIRFSLNYRASVVFFVT